MRKAALSCLVLFLLTASGARGSDLQDVIFETSPSGAEVWLQVGRDSDGLLLGSSGRTVRLDMSKFEGQSQFTITFKLSGYQPSRVDIDVRQLHSDHRYPAAGTVLLARAPNDRMVLWAAAGVLGTVVTLCWIVGKERKRQVDASAFHVQDSDLRTQQLGNYRLMHKIGQGGMSQVYRAESVESRLVVAIKILDPLAVAGSTDRVRFEREQRILRELSHPAIVQTLGWGEQNGLMYLVMEFIEGETLRTLLPPHGLKLPTFARYFRQMLAAVVHAHRNGIVHRDLKPENIMLAPSEILKIVDFGIARAQAHDTVTTLGTVFGSRGYMAPERFHGVPADPRSDQYSLGVVGYEMLCGRLPLEKTMSPLVDEPIPLEEQSPQLPIHLADVIMRMLARDPAARFETVEAAAAAFEVEWARCSAQSASSSSKASPPSSA